MNALQKGQAPMDKLSASSRFRIFNILCIVTMFVLLLFLCGMTNASPAAYRENPEITFTDNVLSIHADDVSFQKVLREIAKETGVKVEIFEGVTDFPVTLDITSLPLYALDRILKKMTLKNSAVVYDDALKVLSIYVLPEGRDISKVVKGGTVIRSADFSVGKEVSTIKGNEFITIEKGKHKLPIRYVRDELLIRFHRGVTEKEIDAIVQEQGLRRISNLKAINHRPPNSESHPSRFWNLRKSE